MNQVLGLEGCSPFLTSVRMNRSVRFGFGERIVLVASSGHPVSFYTTVGGVVVMSFERTSFSSPVCTQCQLTSLELKGAALDSNFIAV